MRPHFNSAAFGSITRLVIAGTLLALAGCASTISARVTSYEQWPGNVQGQKYQMATDPGQDAGNLQYQSVADMIRAALGPTGLVEAAPGEAARFRVSFEYGNPVTRTWVREYNDPYYYSGFGPAFGYWGSGFYGHRGWGGGMFYSPPPVMVPVNVYKNTLTVIIKDNERQGTEVFRSTAVSAGSSDNLPLVMPYLARAVFDGFPGNNNQVRDITYEIPR